MQVLLDTPEIILAGEPFSYIMIAATLATLAYGLLQKVPRQIPKDDGLRSNATRGSYVPLVIGRARTGPLFAWVKDMTTFTLGVDSPSMFGKGGPKVPDPVSFREEALHVLAVGPGNRLIAIYENGEKIWEGDVTPQSHPSGSSFTVVQTSGSTTLTSTFKVYWGFPDDPAISSPSGMPLRFAHAMKILWQPKDLGSSRNWGRLEYEYECPCYSQIATTKSEIPLKVEFSTQWSAAAVWSPTPTRFPTRPALASRTGNLTLNICGYDGDRKVLLSWQDQYFEYDTIATLVNHPYRVPLAHLKPGTIICLYSATPATVPARIPAGYTSSMATILPQANTAFYFRVRFAEPGPSIIDTFLNPNDVEVRTVAVSLDPVIETESLISTLREGAVPSIASASAFAFDGSHPGTGWDIRYLNVRTGQCELSFEDVDTIGYNPVHIVDQLLFARFPYGAGKDRSEWDAQSIENAAAVLDTEALRGSVVVADGEGLESSLAAILQDIGMLTPFDPMTGKFAMRLVRSVEDVPELPEAMVLTRPQLRNIAGERRFDTIVFAFRDREHSYRQETIAEMDNGEFARFQTQKSTTVNIEATTDYSSAQAIARRRSQEVVGDLASAEFELGYGGALAVPGDVFRAPDIEDPSTVFRVSSVRDDINSGKTIVRALVDAYSDVPESIYTLLDGPGAGSPGTLRLPPPAGEDAAPLGSLTSFAGFELPRALAGDKPSVQFFATRGDGTVAFAPVYISRDGSSYEASGRCLIVASGLLGDPLPANGPCNDEGSYEITDISYGFDAQVLDLTLDPTGWRQGRQILVVGSEVIYVQNPEEIGGGSATLTGLLRGRLGTAVQEHVEGERVYIFLAVSLNPVESLAFVPGDSIDYKAVAGGLKIAGDISDVVAQNLTLLGLAYTPERPSALRMVGYVNTYDTGDDITFRWCYHSTEHPRTGLGQQTFGQISGISPVRGYFLVEILDSSTVLATYTTTEPSIELLAADRTALDLLPSWTLRVTQIEGSFQSPAAEIEVFPA